MVAIIMPSTTVAVGGVLAMALGVLGEEDGFCKGANAKMDCCAEGGGLILPIVPMEHTWNRGVRAFLYCVALLWCFLGVSVLSDTFMAGIEAITGSTYKKKVVRLAPSGQPAKDEHGNDIFDEVDELIWNPAVANLTLMALGSSTPEILLSIIEIAGDGFFAGDLGPGTVVGSASFNLYVITGICMVALEAGEIRKIEGVPVYALTASHSLLAYGWLAIVVTVISPDVVEWWEALITFLAMPWLTTWVYCADKDWFRKPAKVVPQNSTGPGTTALQVYSRPSSKDVVRPVTAEDAIADHDPGPARIETEALPARLASDGQNQLEDEHSLNAAFPRVSSVAAKKSSYLTYRRQSCAAGAGALKSMRRGSGPPLAAAAAAETGPTGKARDILELRAAINESFHIGTHSVYHWQNAAYGFPEIDGEAKLTILRTGNTDAAGKIKFHTEDGTARNGAQYEHAAGTVEFEANETSKDISVPLIHDYERNADLDFYVHLEPVEAGGQVDHRSCKTTVTVVDTDSMAGMFAWSRANNTRYKLTDSAAFLLLERRAGLTEVAFSRVRSQDGTATANEHYKPVDEVLEWRPYEVTKQVSVRLLRGERPSDAGEGIANDTSAAWVLRFYVDVVQVAEDGSGVRGSEAHTASVQIDHRPHAAMHDEEEELSWAQQVRQALNVNAGGALEEASVADCIMHWLSIGWKLIASLVPPPHYAGGWACFTVALAMIGCVTAIIGDLASIFGCLVGLKDAVTAFTVVALGTSLPDTFASVLAIRADDSADNAVGNVTGSNAVNVFLGLGFPWLIASIYWQSVGPSDEWRARYGGASGPKWRYYDKYAESGAFVVQGGSLGFNTMIFSILTCFVFLFLFLRRKYVGGEIGGSVWGSRLSAAVLVSVWFIYVLVSALQVYHPENFIEV